MENGQKPEMVKKWKSKWKNGPKLDRGKNGQKMDFWAILREFSIIFPFLGHFCPCPAWGRFPFRFPFFFSISGFWPFSMPYQPGRIPTLEGPCDSTFQLNVCAQTLEPSFREAPVRSGSVRLRFGALSFLSLFFFFGKRQGKPPKKNKDFLSPPNP